jgi:MiaB-like tRNA modifying enzyme
MAKSFFIETYGCSANQNNSEIISGLLVSHGLNLVENESLADIIILNTCIVKEPTIKKIEERLKRLTKTDKKLIICGCMPEMFKEKIEKIAPKASILGTFYIKEIMNTLKKMQEGKKVVLIGEQNEIKLCLPKISKKKTIGIVQICQGCINECSYCLVKKVKGSLFSFPGEKILKEIENNLNAGAKEIWLTSQDNACYGLDNEDKIDLSKIINKISSLNHRFFLRIGMMNPSSIMPITDELIEAYKSEKVFKFLHIPIQSGSNKILKLMNRKYRIEDAIGIIEKFKKQFPEIVIATDIIVGFPGETEMDFQETLKIVKKISPDVLNHSRFWPMKGTEAEKMPNQISREIIKRRETELMNLHAKIALDNKLKIVNKEYRVLVDDKGFENTFLVRNENYQLIIIRSKENLQGKFLKIKIKEAKPHYLIGEIIS